MYVFRIRTEKEEYKKYNGKMCWVPRNPIREDGYIEVYVVEDGVYLMLRPSELEDQDMLDKKFFDKLVDSYTIPTVEMLFDISDKPVGGHCFIRDTIIVEPNMYYEDEIYPSYEAHLNNVQNHIWEILIGKYPTTSVVNPYIYEINENSLAEFIVDHSNNMNLIVTSNGRLVCIPSGLDIFYSKSFPKNYFLILPTHCFTLYKEGTKFYQQEKYERKALEVKMEYNFSIAQNKPYYVVKVVK